MTPSQLLTPSSLREWLYFDPDRPLRFCRIEY
jgi:hypothetical protein